MPGIVLYQPQIPQNTGNIIRFCANTGLPLHIIHPIGFIWQDRRLKRAGLDYSEFTHIKHYDCFEEFLQLQNNNRKFIITTKGKSIDKVKFTSNDLLIFGSEDSGIPINKMQEVAEDHWVRVPMKANSRSMNLANTVAIIGYEAMRQLGFPSLL